MQRVTERPNWNKAEKNTCVLYVDYLNYETSHRLGLHGEKEVYYLMSIIKNHFIQNSDKNYCSISIIYYIIPRRLHLTKLLTI